MKKSLLLFAVILFTVPAISQQYKLGLDLENGSSEGLSIYQTNAFGLSSSLPDSTSLRNYAPYPGNQGNYGTCVGWSFGYCAMTTLYARHFGIENRNIITAMAMCPYSVYNNIRNEYDATCSRGAHLSDAGDFLTSKGTKRFHLHESDCGTTDDVDEGLMVYKADSYSALWEWSMYGEEEKNKTRKTKRALADGNIVLIGMRVSNSFCDGVNEDGEWIKSLDPYDNLPGGGHALCVLGYDDNRLGGTFEIQNSWGQDWGDGGYVYVAYADYQKHVMRAVSMKLEEDDKWSDMASQKGCLFGDCAGEYSLFSFENGDSYEGLIKNGMPEGNGIYQWAEGDVYTGEFKAGLKDGLGVYYYADGTVQKGRWKADLYRADLAYLDYSYGRVNLDDYYWKGYANGKKWIYGGYYSRYGGVIYKGKFSESGEPDDFGMLHRSYKDILSEFNDGAFHGYSAVFRYDNWTLYTSIDDDLIEATDEIISKKAEDFPQVTEAKNDSLTSSDEGCKFGDCTNGYAHYIYESGNGYNGFLINGWRHGYGIYSFKEGSDIVSYEGEYRFGERDGLGRLTMKDGSRFIGEFDNGEADGQGMWIKADGTVQVGQWEKGEFVEKAIGFGFSGGEAIEMKASDKEGIDPAKDKSPREFVNPIQFK